MTNPSLETVHLTKRFGNFVALNDLNLKIEGSKCVGFLGPNGAGKTTTLKMLTDMIFPTSGQAFLNGVWVRGNRKAALENAGVLIETPEIYPSLTPREALEMVGSLRGYSESDRGRRIREVLESVKMSDWIDKKVGKFSKGMKQRINIAASLLSDPEILLLDEPSTGLDPRGMAEVRAIVRELKREHRLIFMSSHILSEVSDVCDEVALVNKGKLLLYDSIANVSSKLVRGSSEVDVGFSRPLPPEAVSGTIGKIPGVQAVELLDPQRVRVRLDSAAGIQEQLFEAIAGLKLGALTFRESSNPLEETYMSLIEKGD